MSQDLLRRRFLASALGAYPAAALAASRPKRNPQGSITDVPGLKVGSFTHNERPTGCTVVLAELHGDAVVRDGLADHGPIRLG